MSTDAHELSPALLRDVRDFFLKDIPNVRDSGEVMPQGVRKIFQSDAAMDEHCRTHFKGGMEAAMQLSASQLADMGTNPNDAMSLILLLDQVSRNVYRGKEAKTVHTVADPIARDLSKLFISEPRNYDARHNWDSWFKQHFLYMPLMHSETLADHKLYQEKVAKALAEAETEGEKNSIGASKGYGTKHQQVIERFGRYPSRNDAMERVSTEEEKKFLKDGPGW